MCVVKKYDYPEPEHTGNKINSCTLAQQPKVFPEHSVPAVFDAPNSKAAAVNNRFMLKITTPANKVQIRM